MALPMKETFSRFQDLDHLSQFLHNCVTGLASKNTLEFKSNCDNKELDSAQKDIQNFYRQCAIQDNFTIPTDLPESVINALEAVYKIRHNDIINSLVKEKLINNGHNLVETFDWKLKWILGSSKLASIREPICQVDFNCANLGKDLKLCKSIVNFECDIEQIDKLISVLNSVKAELEGSS